MEDVVYAAAGIYHPYALPSDQVLLIWTKLSHVYGGWDGFSGPDPVTDPVENPTILDGQNARRGVTAVIYSGTSMMDGFTIRNGNATGKYAMCSATEPAGCGGGFFIAGVSFNMIIASLMSSGGCVICHCCKNHK